MLLKRRTLLALLAGVVLSAQPRPLLAKNGDGPGGHDNGGKDNGNGNGNGNDNDNGGGNDNDGGNDNGVGNDDGGDGDGASNNGSRDDGRGNKKRDDTEWSQDKVLREQQLGRVIPLETALRIVNTKIHGRVIDVDVMVRSGKPQYRVKVRRTDGVIRTVRLDARTGTVIGLLDF